MDLRYNVISAGSLGDRNTAVTHSYNSSSDNKERQAGSESILLVNCDIELMNIIEFSLSQKKEWSYHFCYHEDDILEAYYESNPDCIIFHTYSDDKEQLQKLEEIKQLCHESYVSVLVIVDRRDGDLWLKCLADADEILIKPIKELEYLMRIQKHLDKRKNLLQSLLFEPLTGVYNEKFLVREVQRQLNDIKRSHELLTLVYLEIDELARLKELYGSKGQQQIIENLAEFIQASIRPMDVFAHYQNGFVLVLPKTIAKDAMKLMARLITRFAEVNILHQNEKIETSFSAKVLDFSDATVSPLTCLSYMPFKNKLQEKGCVIDGSLEVESRTVRKLNIAIIDDDRLIRKMLSHQLKDIGGDEFELEIKSFEDGEQFFSDPWHRENERFLLIIDRIMPKMDGLEVLQKIRTGYDRRKYHCMMLTSRDSEAEVALAIQRGANDYMTKPFNLHELRARIKRLIRGSR